MPLPDLNLARQPYVNEAPVRRTSALLWTLALLLTAINAWLYVRHYSGTQSTREQQQSVREQLATESSRIGELRAALATLDIEWLNLQAEFVNQRIGERTFSWSELFDQLTETLPGNVRLTSLAPQFRRGARRESRAVGGVTELAIRGVARNDAAVLELLDRLFQHPRFTGPDLGSETRRDNELEFVLAVLYHPEVASPKARSKPDPEPDGAAPPEVEG